MNSSPRVASSDAHTRMAAASAAIDETKQIVHSPYTSADEFDNLIYTLQSNTFEGGGDSTSMHSIDLDAPTRSEHYRTKRVSIMDTHL